MTVVVVTVKCLGGMRPPPPTGSALLFACFFLLLDGSDAQCRVQLAYPELQPLQYNGSWFVIARKAPSSRSFLPSDLKSSLIRLVVDGDERLNMTEYHSVFVDQLNGTCMPPLFGVWTKKERGYFMELRTENGHLFSSKYFLFS
ncbi:hypothetical protein OESDEN_21524 [Oesophagostomum dentatum]|uniref:Lipocalin/cytosolic fatty-acid binding domain-containing protein n=1 Tax=Oesophagostomum dentatum TaxID=61180 RepID=A0A0B1S6K1_OESDE|nr:hypothetical protein OESDEN_21524 [Oesophagostomum dentatum]